ncbi:iron chaperone [Nocardioides sp.]|uniref:iron chaperone n=1 Tax=Nocardioides sp. TaxID=35761 RepID=UPI003D0F3728
MSVFDDYLTGLTAPADRAALQRVREVVAAEEPGAQEAMSYGMPAFRLHDRPLLGVLASTKHLSVAPFSPRVIEAVRGRLDGFSLTKGTIRFTADAPIPDDVVRDLVRLRRDEIRD